MNGSESGPGSKNFQNSPSHQIFKYVYETLNIDKNKK